MTKHQMLIGLKREVHFPFFFLKTFLLAIVSTVFFVPGFPGKLQVLLLMAILNLLILKSVAFRFFRFLVISSVTITLFWYFFTFLPNASSMCSAFKEMFSSSEYCTAQERLWGLFLTGQMYLCITSRYEILISLKRIRANPQVSLFVVVLFNAVSYFIQSFRDIKDGFEARIPGKRKLLDIVYILNSLTFDAFRVIFECRKAFFLAQDRVFASLGYSSSKPLEQPIMTVSEHIFYRNVCYPSVNTAVLEEAEFDLKAGIILLTGSNGSGKTTLLNLIAGVIPAVIPAEYTEISSIAEETRLNHVGYVPQGNEISFFYDTVSRALSHLPEKRSHFWMKRFGLIGMLEGEKSLAELSAGECKAVALIAELLDTQHTVCLLDEPSAFLSETLKTTLLELLEEARADGKCILIATHDESLHAAADRFLYIKDHKLHECSAPITTKPVKNCSILQNKQTAPIITLNVPQPLLPETDSMEYGTEEQKIICLSRFERIGICGENGAGKTTFGRFILHNRGRGVRIVMMKQALEKQFFTSTAMDELLVGTNRGAESRKEAEEGLKALDMEGLSDAPPQFLSGGEKRALLALCLIMQHPDVLILDEVFDSIDSDRAAKLAKYIDCYQNKSGCCCVFIDQAIEPFSNPIDRVYTVRNFRIEG